MITHRDRLKPGTMIRRIGAPAGVREITIARKTGYTWRYPDVPARDFHSENSSDPHFELGWEVFEPDAG